MAVTRSWTAPGATPIVIAVRKPASPESHWLWLICASLLVACGLGMVFAAKARSFAGAERLVNINTVASPEELLPLLESIPDREQRERRRTPRSSNSSSARGRWRMPGRFPACRGDQCRTAAAGAHQAAHHGAHAARIPHPVSAVGGALFRRLLPGGAGVALRAFPRRPRLSAGAASAHRHGLYPDDQHARPAARHAGIPQILAGCRPGLRAAGAGRGSRVRLSPPLGLVLHALVRRAGPVRAAAAVRPRPGGQRRQGQPGSVPAGGADQDSAGAVPGRLLHSPLGAPARFAGEARLRRVFPPHRPAAAGARRAGAVRHGNRAGDVLRAEGSGAGAGDLLRVPHDVRRGARQAGPGGGRAGADGGFGGDRVSHGAAAHGGGAHRHVAGAVGQRRPRRQPTGACHLGVFDRRPARDRGRAGATPK